MVGDPGVEPGLFCSQSRRVSVSLASGGSGRNRTDSATLARRARYLSSSPPWPPRRIAAAQAGSAACLKMLTLWTCQVSSPFEGLARVPGFEPGQSVLETDIRPAATRMRYSNENRPSGCVPCGRFPVVRPSCPTREPSRCPWLAASTGNCAHWIQSLARTS